MGLNSIRSNLSKEDIIAEIRLTLAADLEHKRSIVIVEGEDDLLFFNGKLQSEVDLHESFSGKCGVIEIVEHFSDDRVIGVCDTDYDPHPTCQRMFFYDYSCLEMMLVSDDSAFISFFYAYYHGDKDPDEVRQQVFSNLKWLSLYRKLSAERNWAINFKGLSLSNAFDRASQSLDITNLLSQIKKLNRGHNSVTREQIDLISAACKEEYNQESYLLITQGHDFLRCFQILCELSRSKKGDFLV